MKYDYEFLALTRRVKDLTGWDDTEDILKKFDLRGEPIRLGRPPAGMNITTLSGTEEWELPLYTTDYLLDKLPYKITRRINYWLTTSKGKDSAIARYGTVDENIYSARSTTHVKALLKLAIEIDAGEL